MTRPYGAAAVALLSLAAVALAACGGTDSLPGVTGELRQGTAISGGTPEQQALLGEILLAIEPTGIEEIRIEPPGPDWTGAPEGSVAVMMNAAAPRGVQLARGW